MSFELSYLQLKTANDSRVADEVQAERRRRNLLVLINQYLEEQGFLDTLQAFHKECGSGFIKKYQVCDNIDLSTILQEFESYHFVKFKKQPKIVKKVSGSAESTNQTPSKSTSVSNSTSKSQLVYHLPPILGGARDSDSDSTGFANEDKRSAAGSGIKGGGSTSAIRKRNSKATSLKEKVVKDTSNKREDKLEIEGTLCSSVPSAHDSRRAVANDRGQAEDEACAHQERLLKPLAGFAGYNSEMRDLAAVISKDIYLENPSVNWDDIIGLDSAKRLIKEAVVYPIKYPQLFTGILSPWKGLLLYGPPGTGKTLLAKAVATECKTTFFNISASSIVSKWRGDSEKLVRVLFELARFHAPSTIFMDELESIMGQRSGFGGGGGEHEGSRRMKTELLVQMDGLSRSNDLVFLLAASNLPWDLDHAMLRRLEKRILVDLPIESARKAMFMHHLPPVISTQPLRITTAIDYNTVARKTEGYSGSDIFLVCKEAAMIPLRKVFDCLEAISDKDPSPSTMEGIGVDPIITDDVMVAIEHTKPSAKTIVGQYEKWQLKYESC